jgi:hypothetical protein
MRGNNSSGASFEVRVVANMVRGRLAVLALGSLFLSADAATIGKQN